MQAYLSPYEESIRTLNAYQPNYQLSETNLYQYRQHQQKKSKGEQIESQPEKAPTKAIRHLGAKFSRNSSNKESQLDRTATKTAPFPERTLLTNINSAKTTRDPLASTITQPANQYIVYRAYTAHQPYQHTAYTTGATAPTNLPMTYGPYTSHYQFTTPQQPPQPLTGVVPKPDVSKLEPIENVQEMLKEFKAELSGQKSDKSKEQGSASPEPNHQSSVEEK